MTRCSRLTLVATLMLVATNPAAFAQGKKTPPPTYYVITDSSSPPQQIGVAVDLVATTKILATFMGEDVVLSVNRNGILTGGEPIYVLGVNCVGTRTVFIATEAFAREIPVVSGQAYEPGDPVPPLIQAAAQWSRFTPADGQCASVAPPGTNVFYANPVTIEVNWTFPLQLVRK
jgi:hypothetical protein